MGLSDITAAIKTILEAVPGIGVVHDYERWNASWDEFLRQFQDGAGKINGCMFARKATPAVRDNMPTLRRDHKILIRCIYGLQDLVGSERTFQALVEAIQAAFDSDNTLGGTAHDSGPAQVEIVENRQFGKVLCHWAEISIEVRERLRYS